MAKRMPLTALTDGCPECGDHVRWSCDYTGTNNEKQIWFLQCANCFLEGAPRKRVGFSGTRTTYRAND